MGLDNLEMARCAIIDAPNGRFPYCIVWTPIPLLTWIFPIIGHMGIGLSNGILRDFSGPYHVAEDNFAFGRPTKFCALDPSECHGGSNGWDRAITEASEIYKSRMHSLCFDNCHSHVAMSLNMMHYQNSTSWNMFKLAFLMLFHGRYVSFWGIVKTWLPFLILYGCLTLLIFGPIKSTLF